MMSSLPQWIPSLLRNSSSTCAGASSTPENEEAIHGRRLAQILRYIAQMHHSLNPSDAGPSFVQQGSRTRPPLGDFFQHDSDETNGPWILFTTADFAHVLAALQQQPDGAAPLFPHPPFSFYAAVPSSNGEQDNSIATAKATTPRKRSISEAFSTSRMKSTASSPSSMATPADGKACWLRLTRLTHRTAPPDDQNPMVQAYLAHWLSQEPGIRRTMDLLTLERLETAPPCLDRRQRPVVQAFLRQYRKYLRRKGVMDLLEPMYNSLFEWTQQSGTADEELVFGLGHARCYCAATQTWVSSPVLEVLVEVEVSRTDGALLVRPRYHTGVSLHRPFLQALLAEQPHTMAALHQKVAAHADPSQICPGQPSTYIPLLTEIALQIAPDASFQTARSAAASSTSSSKAMLDPTKLVLTEAWCLWKRPKPVSVWARDATTFADLIVQQQQPHSIQTDQTPLALPLAAWALTSGPAVVESKRAQLVESINNSFSAQGSNLKKSKASHVLTGWFGKSDKTESPADKTPRQEQPLFPLPTSAPQSRIAELLLHKHHPAVVVEGPPGSGKSHSIANIVCAYLCQGKRVLVTSKNAHALAVLRERLPMAVRDLCVDISMSELSGMRQLQQTVERLANRVSMVSGDLEASKCAFLREKIAFLESDIASIDETISQKSETVRELLLRPDGQRFSSLALELIQSIPWLMRTLATWTLAETKSLRDMVHTLVLEDNDPVHRLAGFPNPPSDALVSKVAARAGESWSTFASTAKSAAASLPLVGSLTGLKDEEDRVQAELMAITLGGSAPSTAADWGVAVRGLRHAQAFHRFEHSLWKVHEYKNAWPSFSAVKSWASLRDLADKLDKAVEMKSLASVLNVQEEMEAAAQCRAADMQRSILVCHRQKMAEELVDATVLMQLSRSFSAEAQSALIRFAQIAGRARFGRSTQASKMTQRQRRRRQEYLAAFDQCCRFIPCWILTTSQISDYLPAEGLFDLVIVDEASQSDVTVLPGMLRGKQWLIVGDSKQVSPTESFISEDQIYGLQAALPESPLRDSLLPGHSFFDLCSQAFPGGRVVLCEHFRCSEELISFSNEHFYDGQLVPLRLPTKSERLSPCLVDVRVNGVKQGKVNLVEVNKIVELIQEIVEDGHKNGYPRSIGVISLIGDDQSRAIRARLLDAIGPHAMSKHSILIGDPPSFQGAERDIIFLTVIASPGSVPTQNQLMHYQRLNVAMSRARDRCYLVRSIDPHHISNAEDSKLLLLNFFLADHSEKADEHDFFGISRNRFDQMLSMLLQERGFKVRPMGKVWRNGLCIESDVSDARAAVLVDCVGEPVHEWTQSYSQQRAIERVGWKCLRIDAVSLVNDFHGAVQNLVNFLEKCGVKERKILYDELEEDVGEANADNRNSADGLAVPAVGEVKDPIDHADEDEQSNEEEDGPEMIPRAPDEEEIYVISSDEGGKDEGAPAMDVGAPVPDAVESNVQVHGDRPDKFGKVVNLDFLREGQAETDIEEYAARAKAARAKSKTSSTSEHEYGGYDSDMDESPLKRRRKRYSKLDKYARDPRWFPGKSKDDEEANLYDTDSDLMEGDQKKDDLDDNDEDEFEEKPKSKA